jgi:ATP-binding protein involved in chromosome partitioning
MKHSFISCVKSVPLQIQYISMITKEKILEALSNVEDPDLKKDLVTLGMIQDLEIKDKNVKFTLMLTTPACPMKDMLTQACKNAIWHLVDKDAEIDMHVTANVKPTVQAPSGGSAIGNIIAVVSGKGGVGKSTVASNLAVSLQKQGARVGLIDADIYGPSIPTMFNLLGQKPKQTTRDGKNYMLPIEQFGVKILSIGFFTEGDQAIPWRGPMVSSALKQFFNDAYWGDLDYLVIDMPPGTGDIHLTLMQQFPVTGAVVVTTPQQVALADAKKAINMFKVKQLETPVIGIVENMAYFTPAELPNNKYYIFGQDGGKKLAEEYQVPFLGSIPIVQAVREAGDEGMPAVLNENEIVSGAFRDIAMSVAQQLSIINSKPKADKAEVAHS